MNVRLSCYANRKLGKNCWTLEINGVILKSKVFKFEGDNIKKNALTCVYQGLRAASSNIKHNDILYIDIQNIHLKEWLAGQKEYKDYNSQLDRVFELIESLDCRYCFQFVKTPFAKTYGENNDFTKQSYATLDDLLDMEESN